MSKESIWKKVKGDKTEGVEPAGAPMPAGVSPPPMGHRAITDEELFRALGVQERDLRSGMMPDVKVMLGKAIACLIIKLDEEIVVIKENTQAVRELTAQLRKGA